MAAFNKAILVGHITAEPELKKTPNDISVTSFSIGINRKTKQGDEAKTDFINIVAWRGTAEFICKYFHKGDAILICGSITTRTWEKDGVKRTTTEVVADEATFVSSKASNTAPGKIAAYSGSDKALDDAITLSPDDELPF